MLEPKEYWVSPTQSDICPDMNGTENITLSDIVEKPWKYLDSNTKIHFCPGTHTTNQTTNTLIQPVNRINIENLALTGGTESTRATVDCGWNLSFAFQNVTNLTLSDMTFIHCGLEIPNDGIKRHISSSLQIQNGTHAALFLRSTNNVTIKNVHIFSSNGYGLLGVNVLGDSSIIGCRFEDNYWKISRSPTYSDQQIQPGGNTLFLLSYLPKDKYVDMTILETRFAHGIERDIQGVKASGGGLGFYLSSQTLTQARFSLFNCTFNNNTTPNGGNLIFITGDNIPFSVYLRINSCNGYWAPYKLHAGRHCSHRIIVNH